MLDHVVSDAERTSFVAVDDSDDEHDDTRDQDRRSDTEECIGDISISSLAAAGHRDSTLRRPDWQRSRILNSLKAIHL